MTTHEDFSRDETPKGGSDRAFGIVFGVVFLLVALYPLLDAGAVRLWALVPAAVFLALALFRPALLAPLNVLWTRLGLVLHHIVNPLVLGLMYFAVLTPTALILRLFGKDLVGRKLDRQKDSYWVERRPPGPPPESMKNQF
jgi:hypothetical protein